MPSQAWSKMALLVTFALIYPIFFSLLDIVALHKIEQGHFG
jgi:hypothetical protein